MCKDKSALLLELEAISSATAAPARKGKGKAAKVRSGRPGVAAGKHKQSGWAGVRYRHWGKWGTEIRMPRTREKVWIGTFPNPRQAALAYDAAVFCFYGERTPKARKINFPAVPLPEISESARSKLSIVDMKVIAEKHARDADARLPPLDGSNEAAPEIPAHPVVPATPVPVPVAAPADGVGSGPAPPDTLNEWDDDEIDRMISAFDIDAFQAELDALTFLVSDDEYAKLCA